MLARSDDLAGYEIFKGALRFTVDTPLPKRLVRKLINEPLRELSAQ